MILRPILAISQLHHLGNTNADNNRFLLLSTYYVQEILYTLFLILTIAHQFSTRDDFSMQGIWDNVWRYLIFTVWGTVGLLASSGQRTQMLLNILQWMGQLPQQRIIWTKKSTVLVLSNPAITVRQMLASFYRGEPRGSKRCSDLPCMYSKEVVSQDLIVAQSRLQSPCWEKCRYSRDLYNASKYLNSFCSHIEIWMPLQDRKSEFKFRVESD